MKNIMGRTFEKIMWIADDKWIKNGKSCKVAWETAGYEWVSQRVMSMCAWYIYIYIYLYYIR